MAIVVVCLPLLEKHRYSISASQPVSEERKEIGNSKL